MRNYWSCSKFADWLRGNAKPGSATSKGWRDWKLDAKSKNPVRFWIVEEGLDKLQDVWCWLPERINDVRYYINNRWVHQTHGMISRSLKKGQWHEFETRLLHSAFDQLVDFVEIEQAWHHCMWDKKAREKYETPWWQKQWFFRWGTQWRCPDAGVEYLIWASGLTLGDSWGVDKTDENFGKPTGQAETAKEVLTLYKWWKYERPQRPDAMDASGWTAYCERRRSNGHDFFDFEDKTPEDQELSKTALDKSNEIEEAYNKEDEEMLIRLVKIRQGLWT